jgi:hypothetical protein
LRGLEGPQSGQAVHSSNRELRNEEEEKLVLSKIEFTIPVIACRCEISVIVFQAEIVPLDKYLYELLYAPTAHIQIWVKCEVEVS